VIDRFRVRESFCNHQEADGEIESPDALSLEGIGAINSYYFRMKVRVGAKGIYVHIVDGKRGNYRNVWWTEIQAVQKNYLDYKGARLVGNLVFLDERAFGELFIPWDNKFDECVPRSIGIS